MFAGDDDMNGESIRMEIKQEINPEVKNLSLDFETGILWSNYLYGGSNSTDINI